MTFSLSLGNSYNISCQCDMKMYSILTDILGVIIWHELNLFLVLKAASWWNVVILSTYLSVKVLYRFQHSLLQVSLNSHGSKEDHVFDLVNILVFYSIFISFMSFMFWSVWITENFCVSPAIDQWQFPKNEFFGNCNLGNSPGWA